MPNIKSAIKRVKTSNKRYAKNMSQKSALRTAIKTFEKAVENKDLEVAKSTLLNAIKKLDKAASKGLIHKNNAARKISRLTQKFNKMSQEVSA